MTARIALDQQAAEWIYPPGQDKDYSVLTHDIVVRLATDGLLDEVHNAGYPLVFSNFGGNMIQGGIPAEVKQFNDPYLNAELVRAQTRLVGISRATVRHDADPTTTLTTEDDAIGIQGIEANLAYFDMPLGQQVEAYLPTREEMTVLAPSEGTAAKMVLRPFTGESIATTWMRHIHAYKDGKESYKRGWQSRDHRALLGRIEAMEAFEEFVLHCTVMGIYALLDDDAAGFNIVKDTYEALIGPPAGPFPPGLVAAAGGAGAAGGVPAAAAPGAGVRGGGDAESARQGATLALADALGLLGTASFNTDPRFAALDSVDDETRLRLRNKVMRMCVPNERAQNDYFGYNPATGDLDASLFGPGAAPVAPEDRVLNTRLPMGRLCKRALDASSRFLSSTYHGWMESAAWVMGRVTRSAAAGGRFEFWNNPL
jgi:hypothetical protein